MGRKVFISFLGATNYRLCDYHKNGISYGGPVRFIQEATLRYLNSIELWGEDSAGYILLTDISKQKNWLDNGQKNLNGDVISQSGLKTILDEMGLPFPIFSIENLPEGNNEDEIWTIFKAIFNIIQKGDELYFDITHGYRYLPMLMLVLGNYAKFLKSVSIKSITYGNFETSMNGAGPGRIVDLLPLTLLQDWTYAAGQFLNSGNVTELEKLCLDSINPILKESKGADKEARNLRSFITYLKNVIEERQTCRGINIINSSSFTILKGLVDCIETTVIPPLNPVFAEIKNSMSFFDENTNINNGLAAAKWCFDKGMVQQSATILQEYVVSVLCMRNGLLMDDENKRDYVNSAFLIKFNDMPEEQWNPGKDKILLRSLLRDPLLINKELINSFHNLTEVRNDLNHSGMRSSKLPLSAASIKKNIEKCIRTISQVLPDFPKRHRVLINLSNHPSQFWSEEQINAGKEYGEIVDIPFPDVSPTADEENIISIAEGIVNNITEIAKESRVTVHIMGEMTLTMSLIQRLHSFGIECIASTSERMVNETGQGHKEVYFQFSRFRRYV